MSAGDLLAIVDVETTGLSPWRADRIVEIAVILASPDGTVHAEYETLVNPERDIGPTSIHGITAGEVLHAPTFSDIAGDLVVLLSRTYALAGHNISFDRNFLHKEYERAGAALPVMPFLCTCRLLGRSSLAACCQEFEVTLDGQPHRALTDARATLGLLRRLIDDDPAVLEAIPRLRTGWPEMPAKEVLQRVPHGAGFSSLRFGRGGLQSIESDCLST